MKQLPLLYEMSRIRRMLVPCCLLIVLTVPGCAVPPPPPIWYWTYHVMPHPEQVPLLNKSVAIVPFVDARLSEASHYSMLAMILPGVPYGMYSQEKPEQEPRHVLSRSWNFNPLQDIPYALAQEIQAAHLFKSAVFTQDADASQTDLVLNGTLSSTKYEAKLFSYGLSIFGGVLWFIGAPAVETTNQIEMQLTLADRTTGQVLWDRSVTLRSEKLHWAYPILFRFGLGSDARYPLMLQEQMPSLLSEMKAALKEYGR